jgi:hypothetical protein
VLAAQDDKRREKWIDLIQLHASSRESNPFGSFAPPRPKSGAKYFVDGRCVLLPLLLSLYFIF